MMLKFDHELKTPLHIACLQGNIDIVDYVLSLPFKCVDINAKEKNGEFIQ